MKNKKLKPFDLKAAKAGAPLVTREGYSVKIYDFDLNHKYYPIVGKVIMEDREYCATWAKDGEACICDDRSDDLFIAPTKKEGWININFKTVYSAGHIYPTKEEALFGIFPDTSIDTVKIEWYE